MTNREVEERARFLRVVRGLGPLCARRVQRKPPDAVEYRAVDRNWWCDWEPRKVGDFVWYRVFIAMSGYSTVLYDFIKSPLVARDIAHSDNRKKIQFGKHQPAMEESLRDRL